MRVRYFRMASGMNAIRTATVHRRDWTTQNDVLLPVPVEAGPTMSDRQALTVTLNGWYVANPWSQLGIELSGTKAAEMNVSGKMSGNDMTWAVSEFGADRPTMAKNHDRA